jgi:hypothetical protein
MQTNPYLYEERRTVIGRDAFKEYDALCRETLWPCQKERGGQVLCRLGGHMGEPAQELRTLTAFPDLSSWQAAQAAGLPDRLYDLVEEESVRLLRPITSRPRRPVPREDRRPLYGYRRFFIRHHDLSEVAVLSENGVWPRFESHGCAVLGLWTSAAATARQEVLLITGYHSLAHWEETRLNQTMPPGFDPKLWERGREAALSRGRLTLGSWVTMMRGLYVEGDD